MRRPTRLKIAFGAILICAGAGGVALAEGLARLVWQDTNVGALPPNSRVAFTTSEFDVVASTNRFGFRGRQAKVSAGQIVTIGDSFVFGWGVSDGDTWQERLQARLQSAAMPLAVYNLGRSGADPDDYLEIARRAIPTLRPRLVILSILQGDDPAQLLEKIAAPAGLRDQAADTAGGFLKSPLRALKIFAKTNLRGLVSVVKTVDAGGEVIPATKDWAAVSKEFIAARKLRFPAEIEKLALEGNLNPGLLSLAAEFPHRFVQSYDDGNAALVERRLVDIVGEIRLLAQRSGGSLILLSMPYKAYFDRTGESLTTLAMLGFELPPANFCKMDDLIERIGKKLDIPYIILTNSIRRRGMFSDLSFRHDGHSSPKGNELIAELLANRLTESRTSDRSIASEPCAPL